MIWLIRVIEVNLRKKIDWKMMFGKQAFLFVFSYRLKRVKSIWWWCWFLFQQGHDFIQVYSQKNKVQIVKDIVEGFQDSPHDSVE